MGLLSRRLAVLAGLVLAVCADEYGMPTAEQEARVISRFGVLQLPEIDYDNLPARCSFPDPKGCQAEAIRDYATAFFIHEQRLTTCGWHGFGRNKILGEGKVAPVYVLTSPCGLQFTGKFGRSEHSVNHVARNCDFLRLLAPHVRDPGCTGCFPEYYHFSNYTGVCYAELVHAMPMPAFLDHINRTHPEAVLQTAKLALRQGMNALRIMQSQGMRHQDLTFRNVMVRVRPQNDPAPFRVVIFDFGVSYMEGLKQDIKAQGGMGNHGFPDAHAWACAFYSHFYRPGAVKRNGCLHLPHDLSEKRPGSLERALLEMMLGTRKNYDNVDYTAWQAVVHSVTTL
jgi:hypothetical protein